jgi:replication factor A1
LVERTASETSQNMKIDAADQAVSLETAIGKTRLFYIGTSPDSYTNFSIKYVLRKSFQVDNTMKSLMPPSTKVSLLFSDIIIPYIQLINTLNFAAPIYTCQPYSTTYRF